MSEPGLVVSGLAVRFGAVHVLRDVNLEVGPGEVVGLVGPNGVGKTTTLRAVSGVVPRYAGTVSLDGEPLGSRPDLVARRGVGHVPEGRGLFPDLTVQQNLYFAAVAVGRRPTRADLVPILEFFPALEQLLDRKAGLLSGGEQQMVAIGRGLVAAPKVLMVDELSLGLAPRVVTEVLERLLQASRDRGIGLLLVDQNVRALTAICDRMYTLGNGRSQAAEAGDEEFMRVVYFGSGDSGEPGLEVDSSFS
jgi:branched-chain amino acid transport system ATP-binding protein